MIILIIFAILAGIVTVLSPCILPILPILLSAGIGQNRHKSYGIIIGLIASFSFFTLTLTAIVAATGVSPDCLRFMAILLIIFFGLTMLIPKLGNFFESATSKVAHLGSFIQEKSTNTGSEFWSGIILGVALGVLWTPCAGPILASITTLVATHSIGWPAIIIIVSYSVGSGIAMLTIMYGGSKLTSSIGSYSPYIRQIFGALMIAGALSIVFHADVILQQLALKYFPMVIIDDNEIVKKELVTLNPNAFAHNDGMAPDFIDIQEWINSKPLTIKELEGHVVLVDFWTYSCINCIRTLPYIKKWHEDYKDHGLIIVGVHTPEFEFEKNPDNVKNAIARLGITYPVALDNGYKTWQNYNNHYWPAHYLIDRRGIIKETHFGEGAYLETENNIRNLLGLSPIAQSHPIDQTSKKITPETYLGYERATSYHPSISLQPDQAVSYDYQGSLGENQVGLKGLWNVHRQSITSQSSNSILDFDIIANRVYVVMESNSSQLVHVLLDGKPLLDRQRTVDMNQEGQIIVNQARMYDVANLNNDYGYHKLTLHVPQGVSLYAFTFG